MSETSERQSLGEDRVVEAQYALLRRCAETGDAAEWNRWRRENPDARICLQGARLAEEGERPALRRINLCGANLARARAPGAILVGADLRDAVLTGAHLGGAILVAADLRGADLREADLRGANLRGADLRGATCAFAKVNGETLLLTDRVDRGTDFTGVALAGARIEPGLEQLLEYNVRRGRWRRWYASHPVLALPTRLFWATCDYGRSTWRILFAFAVLAVAFALAYMIFPETVVATWADEPHPGFGFGYALYFSVVTMTTLGFGDVYASPDSGLGQVLLCSQVVLGYVLLGALVTRFAILFTAGGPSASFYRERPAGRRGRQAP